MPKKKTASLHHPIIATPIAVVGDQPEHRHGTSGARAPNLYYPTSCVFDLDPSKEDEPDVLRAVALALRDLEAWPAAG